MCLSVTNQHRDRGGGNAGAKCNTLTKTQLGVQQSVPCNHTPACNCVTCCLTNYTDEALPGLLPTEETGERTWGKRPLPLQTGPRNTYAQQVASSEKKAEAEHIPASEASK